MKKSTRDVIILHMCTKNHGHVMYFSWDMECVRQNFLSFLAIFRPFTPLTIKKIKILKKWNKTSGDIIILHMCTINEDIWCMFPEIWRDRHNFLSFWTICCPFTHLPTHKIKLFRKRQKCLEILMFYAFSINYNHMICSSWDMEQDRQSFCHFSPFLAFLPT